MSRGVGNDQVRLRFLNDCLGSHTAGPENGDLSLPNRDGIPIVRSFQIRDPDGLGPAYVNRGTMHHGVPGGDLHGPHYQIFRDGTHRDDEVSPENSRGLNRDGGLEHGDIPIFFNVTHGDIVFQQGLFKGKTAPQKKCHEIVLPEGCNRLHFPLQASVPVDPVFGNVSPDIRPVGHELGEKNARLKDFQNRAGLGVSLAEEQEIKGIGLF